MEIEAEGDALAEHDHAWRRVETHNDGVFGEYRCDICNVAWFI